jgi:hypothetical protein
MGWATPTGRDSRATKLSIYALPCLDFTSRSRVDERWKRGHLQARILP